MKLKFENNVIEVDDLDSIDLDIKGDSFVFIKNGERKKAFARRFKDQIFVSIDGVQYSFTEMEDDWDSSNSQEAQNEIKSPMPGSVVKLLVKEGDEVKEGQALIIVEAMKMETTLYSTMSGKIVAVNTIEKQQIDSDQVLIEIE